MTRSQDENIPRDPALGRVCQSIHCDGRGLVSPSPFTPRDFWLSKREPGLLGETPSILPPARSLLSSSMSVDILSPSCKAAFSKKKKWAEVLFLQGSFQSVVWIPFFFCQVHVQISWIYGCRLLFLFQMSVFFVPHPTFCVKQTLLVYHFTIFSY